MLPYTLKSLFLPKSANTTKFPCVCGSLNYEEYVRMTLANRSIKKIPIPYFSKRNKILVREIIYLS